MNTLQPLTITVYANGSRILTQDCAMEMADWEAFKADQRTTVVIGVNGKPFASQANCNAGVTSVVAYQER